MEKAYSNEMWLPVPGIAHCWISSAGRVKSTISGKDYFYTPDVRSGYLNYRIDREGKSRVKFAGHRMVATLFIPNPENKSFVNHINNDRTDNRVENLEWVTPKENTHHAIKVGAFTPSGPNAYAAKLTDEQVIEIRKRYAEGESGNKLAKEFAISRSAITPIINGKGWKHLPLFDLRVRMDEKIGRKVAVADHEIIMRKLMNGCKLIDIAKEYGVERHAISRIKKRFLKEKQTLS